MPRTKKFYFLSIPYYNYDQTSFGKTTVYEAKTNRKLYQIDNYLPQQSFLSNNGHTLITTTYWMWGHSDFENQPLIQFYKDGQKSNKLFLQDLVGDTAKLQYTSSHTLWYDAMFMFNDTLFLNTLDSQVILINANSTKIIGRIPRSFISRRFDLSKLPELRTVINDKINYPEGWQFPKLTNGVHFKQALCSAFRKQETQQYDSCTHYIQVYGTVDRRGGCKIFMLETSVNRKEDKGWDKRVSDWVNNQKYTTNLIPDNCEKWVFKEYLYLR